MDWSRHAGYLLPADVDHDWIDTLDTDLTTRELASGECLILSTSAMPPTDARRVEQTISRHLADTHLDE